MKKSNNGMKLAEVLLVIFIVLKLTGVIQWSWLWVLSPLWISLTIILILLVFYIIANRKEVRK